MKVASIAKIAIVLAPFTLSACVTGPLAGGAQPGQGGQSRFLTPPQPDQASYSSPVQKELASEVSTFTSTVAEGALIGAGVGAVAGLLVTGDARGAVLGAALGGAVGGVAGQLIASQQEDYAKKEGALDSIIADARTRNEHLTRIVSLSEKSLKENRKSVASLRSRYSKAKRLNDDDRRKLASMHQDLALFDKAIQTADAQLQDLRAKSDGFRKENPAQPPTALDATIASFSNNKDRLGKIGGEYRKMLASLPSDVSVR